MASTFSTRRSVLTAMALAPVAIAIPAIAITSNSGLAEWNRVYGEWEAADRAAKAKPSDDSLWDAESATFYAAIHTPAPHTKALHWKLNYLFGTPGSNGYCDAWSNEIMAAVLADAKRLVP